MHRCCMSQSEKLQRIMLVVALVALGSRFGAFRFLLWLQRLHYRLTAETPQLVFKHTPLNEKLLERCETMSTYQTKSCPLIYLS